MSFAGPNKKNATEVVFFETVTPDSDCDDGYDDGNDDGNNGNGNLAAGQKLESPTKHIRNFGRSCTRPTELEATALGFDADVHGY